MKPSYRDGYSSGNHSRDKSRLTLQKCLLCPVKSETVEDDHVSGLASPRQKLVIPFLNLLHGHVLIRSPTHLRLHLKRFFSIPSESDTPGSFLLLQTCEDGTSDPTYNDLFETQLSLIILLCILGQPVRATDKLDSRV